MKIQEYNFTGKGHFLNKYWVLSGFIISEKGKPGRWKGGLMKIIIIIIFIFTLVIDTHALL